MDISYPDGVSTTAEEREFDSFLLSYITEQALKQRSPKRPGKNTRPLPSTDEIRATGDMLTIEAATLL